MTINEIVRYMNLARRKGSGVSFENFDGAVVISSPEGNFSVPNAHCRIAGEFHAAFLEILKYGRGKEDMGEVLDIAHLILNSKDEYGRKICLGAFVETAKELKGRSR
jgi:hypothetical protein